MFAYSLAKELGYVNVDQMLADMTATQFSEWVAYCECENERAEERRGSKPRKVKGKGKANMFKAWFAPKIKRKVE